MLFIDVARSTKLLVPAAKEYKPDYIIIVRIEKPNHVCVQLELIF